MVYSCGAVPPCVLQEELGKKTRRKNWKLNVESIRQEKVVEGEETILERLINSLQVMWVYSLCGKL